MRISTSCSDLQPALGPCKAIEAMARIGFDGVDFAFFMDPVDPFPYADEGYVREIRQAADAAGIAIAQTHTPFPTYVADPERDELIFAANVQALKATALLGSRYAVVHPQIPVQRLYRRYAAETKERNLAFYQRLLPYAHEYDVHIAIENMWAWDPLKGCIAPTVCSTPEELCEYIDMLEDDHVVACLDTGHAVLTSIDPAEWIEALGTRLQVLHVHDVDGRNDNHFAPMLGVTDWKPVMHALKKIGYSGYFNLESNGTCVRFPPELSVEVQALMLKVAQYLVAMEE